ncbi:Abi family protein [Streptococcus mutans]|uniref:Abi family protein n=1 Tax=Streptococcus mutans TaxID=1309 RepID=UPI0002B5E709|nr:Abi family protein [Streptococcus mutans]EMC45102.1 hypothetical protein SMU98_02423 [Streptococcus mutans SM1]MCB5002600.1 Abi family protein [Streptococcus mutans]MCB5030252.1 Abi family protein [Streptococcus mutans]
MKQAKTIDEQLDILQNRGLVIKNQDYAYKVLQNINYYTLTGYLYLFKEGRNYCRDTSLELVVNLYQFDNEVRNLLLSLTTEAEQLIKTRIAYQIALSYPENPYVYTDKTFFKNGKDFERFMEHFTKTVRRNRERPFVKHHINHYGSEFPIWVAVELFTMGNLKYLYKNLPSKLKKTISRELNLSPETFYNWIENIRILRNNLAHNMRLYGTTNRYVPKFEKHHEVTVENNRLFVYFLLLKELSQFDEHWSRNLDRLKDIIQKYSDSIDLKLIGFPENWEDVLSK